jgi:hypothetical protein
VVVHAPQVVAVDRRERPVERKDLQAVLRQVEVADDLRPQQRHDVGRDAEPEAGEDLLGDGRAAEDVAPLEDDGSKAGTREVGRGGEAVVAPADHDRVVPLPHPIPLVTRRRAAG